MLACTRRKYYRVSPRLVMVSAVTLGYREYELQTMRGGRSARTLLALATLVPVLALFNATLISLIKQPS